MRFSSVKNGLPVVAATFLGLAAHAQAAVVATYPTGAYAPATGVGTFAGTPTVATTDNANAPAFTAASFQGAAFSGQTFTTGATGFTLDKLAFVLNNPTAAQGVSTLSVQLYPVTGTVSGGGAGTDGKGTSQGAQVGAGLLSSLTFSTLADGSSGIETLDLTGTDEVALAANTTYYVEIGGLGNASIRRGSETYTNGNAYSRATTGTLPFTIFSGATRDAPFAIYAAALPEPTTLAAAAALAGVGLSRRRRHA